MDWKKVSLIVAGCLCIGLVAFVSNKKEKTNYEAAKEIIVMRKIAHDILQHAGDSNSRILPVNRVSGNEFQIPFEAGFSFQPDSLVRIIDKAIEDNKLPSNYIVNVLEYNTNKVIFGYAISGSGQDNIVPCMGREQPLMRYSINIKFPEDASGPLNKLYLTGMSLLGIGLLLAASVRYKKNRESTNAGSENSIFEMDGIPIGKYQFYPEKQYLVFNKEKTDLTMKESKLLGIFAEAPNQVIDRNRLQQFWEDEGVIVGRSLDVFVSRLRKKLENDPEVKLVNIHGKGYKLEV